MTNDKTRTGLSADVRPEDLTERQLDQVVEDSFPASDPPSTSPLTGVGESATGAMDRTVNVERKTGPSCIITYIGEDLEKYGPVINAGLEAAKQHGSKLIFYDAEAGGRFGSPTPTFWSGDRDKETPSELAPADLEAAGRMVIGRLVAEARAAGVDAWGWLPDSRGAEALNAYAEEHGADLIILPSDLENVPALEKFTKGTADAKKIIEEANTPVMTVDIADDKQPAPGEQVTFV